MRSVPLRLVALAAGVVIVASCDTRLPTHRPKRWRWWVIVAVKTVGPTSSSIRSSALINVGDSVLVTVGCMTTRHSRTRRRWRDADGQRRPRHVRERFATRRCGAGRRLPSGLRERPCVATCSQSAKPTRRSTAWSSSSSRRIPPARPIRPRRASTSLPDPRSRWSLRRTATAFPPASGSVWARALRIPTASGASTFACKAKQTGRRSSTRRSHKSIPRVARRDVQHRGAGSDQRTAGASRSPRPPSTSTMSRARRRQSPCSCAAQCRDPARGLNRPAQSEFSDSVIVRATGSVRPSVSSFATAVPIVRQTRSSCASVQRDIQATVALNCAVAAGKESITAFAIDQASQVGRGPATRSGSEGDQRRTRRLDARRLRRTLRARARSTRLAVDAAATSSSRTPTSTCSKSGRTPRRSRASRREGIR